MADLTAPTVTVLITRALIDYEQITGRRPPAIYLTLQQWEQLSVEWSDPGEPIMTYWGVPILVAESEMTRPSMT